MEASVQAPGVDKTAHVNDVPAEIVCQEFVELITDYFEQALPAEQLNLVEEHLVLCDWCRTYLDQMRGTVAALNQLGDEGPAEPSKVLLDALRNRRESQP